MSAYVVSDKTINRIVTFAMLDTEWRNHNPLENKRTLEAAAELSTEMVALNVKAVNHRYCEDSEPESHVFAKEKTGLVQAMMSIRCWMYQCSEGDIDKSPLFKLMTEYLNELAHAFVAKSPEWEKAEWG